MSWLCKTLELATIPCAMPQLAWTTKVHQDSILRLRPLISSSLDLERQSHQCRDGYLLLREAGVMREERTIRSRHAAGIWHCVSDVY